jgi:hypothetical protein
MSLARTLHEMYYGLPRGGAQTMLLWAMREDWTEESCRRFAKSLPHEALVEAIVTLTGTVARYREPVAPKWRDPYPPNGVDL